ncbi:MAG: septum formation protein Maf [Bacteroides sp.]|nr:septum formation protein Maf [Bacteroides sp.]
MLENLKKYQITLASNSPRRKELLSGLNLDYKVKILPDIDETYPDTLKGEDIPLYIARKKAEAYKSIMSKNELIITADTIVYTDGEVLGKPKDEADARRMLHALSGRSHQVITGVCITTSGFQRSFASVTEVTFDTLTDEEVDFYISTYSPMDKAGAYGIQEWIGFIGVSKLNGSYFNVMGLPVQRLYRELKNID